MAANESFSLEESIDFGSLGEDIMSSTGDDTMYFDQEQAAEEEKEPEDLDPQAEFQKQIENLSKEESEKESKEEESQTEQPEEGEPEEDDSNEYGEYANVLSQLGVLNLQEGEVIDSEEALREKILTSTHERANQMVSDYMGRFGEEQRDAALEAFDAIFNKGIHPRDWFTADAQEADLESADLDDVETQKSIFRDYMRMIGHKDDYIERKLDKHLAMEDLDEEIPVMHEKLLEVNRNRKQQLIQEHEYKMQQQAAYQQQYTQTINDRIAQAAKEGSFMGLPIGDKKAEKVRDYLTVPRYRLPDGTPITEYDRFILEMKNPESWDKRIQLAILAIDDFKTSAIEKKAVTKETNSLFAGLKKKNQKSASRKQEEDNNQFIL